MTLEEVLGRLDALPPEDRKKAVGAAVSANKGRVFIPNIGPQTDAYFSQADQTFFGGGAGSGKSALLCGTALEDHQKSIIFRREYPQIKGLVDEVARMLGTRDGYNGQERVWKLPNGNQLEFGSVPHEDDKEKYQGRAHDFIGFDEITHFTESQFRFLIGWNRPADLKNVSGRCRIIATGNPPMGNRGGWVKTYWGAWLNPNHPNPAKPGEIRWYCVVEGEDTEVDGPGEHFFKTDTYPLGKMYLSHSRTFIHAKLENNPDMMASGYAATIESMPEPMRTMLREGRFDLGEGDTEWQVIPSKWIEAAQARWTKDGYKDFAMTAMGFDPAGGGADAAELCWRHGPWYAPLVTVKGDETANGSEAAARIIAHRRDNAPVIVDVGGGYGGAVTLRLKDNGISHSGFNGASGSTARTRDGQLAFANKRAEAWWKFKEELDPDQEGGSVIALPPDPELRADLAAPTYSVAARGILIESKDDIRKRLGRSPGKGDAVVMALSEGNSARRKWLNGKNVGQAPKVNLGHAAVKSIYRR